MDAHTERPDAERLLAHASWARRLAASLVGEGDADDLVQETWRIALERPPRAESAAGARAWLGRVLASLGRDARTKRSTRAWHEEHAAKREAVESDTEERAELQKLLAEAVYSLEEPYRTAIVLRYFDGLDARAIAERQGVSHDAARQRVSRGLATLRERLDRNHRGGRAAWSAVCVAWVHKSPLTGASSALAAGGSIVAAKLAAALGAVLLLAALSFWWLGGAQRDAEPSGSAAANATPPASLATDSNVHTAVPTGTESARAELATGALANPSAPRAIDRERDLHGLVVDPNGKPIAGAELEVLRREFSEVGLLDLAEIKRERAVASARSDERGEFVFPLPAGRAFDLRVVASGFAPRRIVHLHAGERVVVELAPGASLSGRVGRRGDGSAVARAMVELQGQSSTELPGREPAVTTRTDADGHYRFDGLAAGEYLLELEPERDAPPEWIRFELAAGETRAVDVLVDSGVTLRGRVLDASTGLGIAGADVGEGWIAKRRVTTDFDGSFVFEGFATDGYYDVSVQAPGYGGANVKVRDPDGPFPESLEVRLQPGRAAHGRIVDSNGSPIEGAYVGAAAYEIDRDDMFAAQQLDWLGARSGGDGRFRLVDLRADLAHALHVRLDGFGSATYAFPSNESELSDVDLGDIVLRDGALVRGRVVDERGEPVPGFVVQLIGWNADRGRYGGEVGWALESYLSERATRTDDLGRFAFADVAAGDYDLLAVREGSHDRAKTPIRVGGDGSLEPPHPIDLVVPAGLAISGRVVDRDGKPVVANISVDPNDPNVKTTADVATRTDGSFVADGLAAGEYSLTVYPHSLWSSEPNIEHHARTKREGVATGSSGIELVVEHALSLRGRVVRADGRPVEGGRTVEVVARRDAADPNAQAAIVKPDGRFTLWLTGGVRFELEATEYFYASPGRLVATERKARLEGVLAGGDEVELVLP